MTKTIPESQREKDDKTDEIESKDVEKGETERTRRDMQAVTDHFDERPIIDIRNIERAIDKLVKIREMDLKTAEKPFVPKKSVKPELIEKTGETKSRAEKFLDATDGDIKKALISWIETPFGLDYDSVYPAPQPITPLNEKI